MAEAKHVFDTMIKQDVLSWNALIHGYTLVSEWKRVLQLFQEMHKQQVKPDDITFISLLTVSCHCGLIEQGNEYMEVITSQYGIVKDPRHYACMVGMLGHANRLQEAVETIRSIPFDAMSSSTWMTLLGASCEWEDVGVGKLAFDSILKTRDGDCAAAAYVLIPRD